MQNQLQNVRFPSFIYCDLVNYLTPKKENLHEKRVIFLLIAPLQICSFSNAYEKLCCFCSQVESSNKAFPQNSKM